MRRNPLVILFIAFYFLSAYAGHDHDGKVITPHISPSLRFTENKGQWAEHILFRAQLDGGGLYLEKDGLTFNFYDKKKYRALHHGGILKGLYRDLNIGHHGYKVHFENCNPNATTEKMQMGPDYENFFRGKDPRKWHSNVRNYHQVWLRNLYNNIDYEAITSNTGIKYNFHVKAGANPDIIKMRYEGVDNITLKNGVLTLKLLVNEIVEQKPYAYQMINGQVVPVRCNYRLKDNVLSFVFPDGYNRSYDLVIDPVLVFAAQSGSLADNFGMTATFDPYGNLYAGGTAYDNGYPTTLGAFSSTFAGTPIGYDLNDVVITKYNATGTALLYSTYFGGTESDIVTSMIVDSNNNLCFYGATGSSDLPVTQNAYDTSFNGGHYLKFTLNGTTFTNGTDIYIGKFNSSGTALLGCTYLGGSDNDGVNYVNHFTNISLGGGPPVLEYFIDSLQNNYGDQYRGEIQLDAANNIYIASSTRSSDFPAINGFDNTLNGKQDAVLAKFNTNLTSLIYSSYVGGNSNDAGNSLIVRMNQEVYMTGGTCSGAGFPGSGGYQSTYQGGSGDGFIVHVNAAGNGVLHRTFFGTAQYDQSYFIQDDKYGNIYIYGQSQGNIPVVVAANQTTIYTVPNTHQFVSRFNPTLSSLNMSTVFGHVVSGKYDISPSAFSVDKCNNIYLSGWGGDILGTTQPLSNMPLFNATQSTTDGFDFYFMGLDSNAHALKYGSYFGGGLSHEHVDGGTSRFDSRGRIYQSACAGCWNNDDFPVTPGAWPGTPGDPNHSTLCNNGVVKLDFQLQLSVATISTNTLVGCAPFTASFTNATPDTAGGATYVWYLGNGNTTSTTASPVITYTLPGTYTVSLVVNDNLTCNKKDSVISIVTVNPRPSTSLGLSPAPCSNTVTMSANGGLNLGTSPFVWSFDDGTPSTTLTVFTHTYANNGVHSVSLTVTDLNGCTVTKTGTLATFNFTAGVVNSASLCSGTSTVLTAGGGTSYTWSPGGTLSSTSVAAPVANPPSTTIYTVQILNTSQGYGCSTTLTTQIVVKPTPTANFALAGDRCSNVVTTSNNSSGNFTGTSFDWNFGNGTHLSDNAPAYTYPGNGTYTVSLTVTDANGCASIKTNTVAIFNFTPGVVNSASICSGFTTNITALGGTNYTWTPAVSLNDPSLSSPMANPSVTTVYTVNILNTTPGYDCARTLTTEILVRASPVSAFGYSANPCGGGVYFTDHSTSDVTNWQWSLAPNTSTVQNPYVFYHTGGTFTISLSTTNNYGCKSIIQNTIDIATPPAVAVSSSASICIGDSVKLHASGGTSYEWAPAQSLDYSDVANPTASPKTSTEYSVNITSATTNTIDGKACQLLLTTQVDVTVLSTTPINAMANPVIVTTGSASTLTYLGSPGALVNWLPQNSTTPPVGYTVSAKPDRPTTYTAVVTSGPCQALVQVHVDAYTEGCLDKDVFIPNTFTPNGDGENDLLYVRGLKVTDATFSVYNRWGELVFETSDKNTGWDGRYKGKPADVGVYGWYLKAKCYNGEETFKKGNVTLIR